FRHHDRSCEMNGGVDAMLCNDITDQRAITGAAGHERNRRWNQETEPGREVVENDHRLARSSKARAHMAADISSAAGNEDCHAMPLISQRMCARMILKISP